VIIADAAKACLSSQRPLAAPGRRALNAGPSRLPHQHRQPPQRGFAGARGLVTGLARPIRLNQQALWVWQVLTAGLVE
jgi:hypothetical protein